MAGLTPRVPRVFVAALLGVVLWTPACRAPQPVAPPRELVIGTVFAGGSWDLVGRALAEVYSERLPGVKAVVRTSEDLWGQADLVDAGESDLAIEDVETAYVSYRAGTKGRVQPHRNLRAIAVLFSTAVQIVAHTDAGIVSLTDLRGKRVGLGAKGSPTERAATLILESHGVPLTQLTPVVGPGSVDAFQAGALDAVFIYAPFQNPAVAAMSRADGVRLVPIERRTLGAIQERHHFLKSTTIPGGTYRNQEEDVLTVGMDVLLICRQELPEDLVYDLARTLFDAVPALRAAHASAGGIDPERGPTAAIPLHPGAARYYREREILK